MYCMAGYKRGKGGLVKRAKRAVKKRYTSKRGGVKVGKMAKDIMYLKSVLNPEKKRITGNSIAEGGNLVVGQSNGLVDGAFLMDAHPGILQGVTNSTRNGSSVKMHSSVWHMKFTQQSASINPIKGVIEIWSITDQAYASNSTFFTTKFDLNPFIGAPGVRDVNAQYDPDFYTMGKCIARRKFTVKGDDLSNQLGTTDIMLPIKYNRGKGHHLRFQGDTGSLASGQLIMIIRTNRGNCSTATASTMTGLTDTAINTGLQYQFNVVHYYYDN